jgi:arsenate reductase (glutaredoxin)
MQNKQQVIVYGIKNCQTVQKAIKFLDSKNLEINFWDYKKQGVNKELLTKWCDKLSWQKVLNRSGMMWRKSEENQKAKVIDQLSAIEFMLSTPTSIKRPIIEFENNILVGFDEENYNQMFA